MRQNKIYGEFAVGLQPFPQLPQVDKIMGVKVVYDNQGKPKTIVTQYKSGDEYHEITMDYLNALFVLSLLKSIQLDAGTPFPDDPRGLE